MWRKKSKIKDEKFKIPDYTKLHLNMLLYKSRQHYETWLLFNENVPEDLKKEFKEDPRVHLPDSFWTRMVNFPRRDFSLKKEFLVPPLIVDTFNFTEEDLDLAKKEYKLFGSEEDAGRCPFCRVDLSNPHMRILSEKPTKEWWKGYTRGTLEGGGVSALCIHLLFKENFELLDPEELWRDGWQMSPEIKNAVRQTR